MNAFELDTIELDPRILRAARCAQTRYRNRDRRAHNARGGKSQGYRGMTADKVLAREGITYLKTPALWRAYTYRIAAACPPTERYVA